MDGSIKSIMASNAKEAVVTGSSSGIGLATALELARKGFFTYATARNPAKARAVPLEGAAAFLQDSHCLNN